LVVPTVDLPVVTLLLDTRHLALNVAEPVAARHYGEAAFDAVDPLLLIGCWPIR